MLGWAHELSVAIAAAPSLGTDTQLQRFLVGHGEQSPDGPKTVVYANAVMAGIDIYVDASTHVVVEGVGIMGAFDQGRDKVTAEITADSPVLRVKRIALMAGVTVTRKGPPGQLRRKLLGGR